MLAPLSSISAYRSDLDRYSGRHQVSKHDGLWILTARVLEQLSESRDEERSTQAQRFAKELLSVTSSQEAPQSLILLATLMLGGLNRANGSSVFDAVLKVAESMERIGTLQLAFSTISYLRRIFPEAEGRQQGRALAVQARIAREIGDLDGAVELYERVSTMAVDMSMVDVASEAARGLGGVALARGNLPNARHHYEKALQSARLIGASILEARAHRGLLIVTAKERDYEAAIQHAWEAFELSSDDTEGQGELLANLGGLLRECGHFGASFLSYSLAIKWTDSTRIRIPSLGGAALSAALDHKPIYVGILANLIESEVRRGVPPFEAAQVLLDLASAYEAIDAKKAIEISREAEALSHQHGYFELEYLSTALIERLTSARPEVARAPIGFSNSSKRVIDSVAALAHRHSSVIALVGTKE